ncbi:MAG TPA: hypothetical protein VK437_12740 [Steroidobacteraceae bacterium]|nr:hypothetical protein [Steroidobacteraceae bacterium]
MASIDDLESLLARKDAVLARLDASPALSGRVRELRAWQAARLAQTYADLSREPRHAAAVEFFMTDLYGPQEFARRDRDLRRALHSLKRMLPAPALRVLERAVALDVVSAELDEKMAEALPAGPITPASYAAAYRSIGNLPERDRQIDLLVAIGEDLDRFVRRPWVGIALRAAHVPAHAAGFGVLQDFLERGFDAFRQMPGAEKLLAAIRERETRLMEALFSGSNTIPGADPLWTRAPTTT